MDSINSLHINLEYKKIENADPKGTAKINSYIFSKGFFFSFHT